MAKNYEAKWYHVVMIAIIGVVWMIGAGIVLGVRELFDKLRVRLHTV
jgi:hypothetical protein